MRAARRREIDVLERSMTWALAGAIGAAVVATLALVSVDRVAANDCGSSCRNAYNQCRISTKGSPSCESQFTSCMQGCIRR